jgi:hypothetical protein
VGKFIIKLVYKYYRVKQKCPLDWIEVLSLTLTIVSTILMILEYAGIIKL